MFHAILTNSSYHTKKGKGLVRRRWFLTQHICIASLLGQTNHNFVWFIRHNPADFLHEEKVSFYEQLPFKVVLFWHKNYNEAILSYIETNNLHPTTLVTTRIDDDDAFAIDSIERIQNNLRLDGNHHVHTFRKGLILANKTLIVWLKRNNQFVTLESPMSDLRTVRDIKHGAISLLSTNRRIRGLPPFNASGYIWYRHRDAITPMFCNRHGKMHFKHAMRRFTLNWEQLYPEDF